jgi:SAM-dependent methyltransferase
MKSAQTACRTYTDPEWFIPWFDSAHYQKLYSHRDQAEAARFVDALVDRLHVDPRATVLDLACGTGRHAKQLASHGCRVLGIDLSAESISAAKESEGPNLWFRRQDMRLPFGDRVFDYVFNLFTSFGYFADLGEHLTVVHNVAQSLKPGGRFVLDYLNVARAENRLVPEETAARDAATYHIRRWADGDHIFKHILVNAPGERPVEFTERVAKLTPAEFRFMFELCGLSLVQTYGDYDLSPFDVDASPRLIMVARKCERTARSTSSPRQVLADAADGFGGHAEVGGEHHLRNAERNRGIDAQEFEVALLG